MGTTCDLIINGWVHLSDVILQISDLSLDKIDSTYFQNGLGFPHGEDKDGCILG